MSLPDLNLNNLTACWEKQLYDPRLSVYKHLIYPRINGQLSPLGNHFNYIFDFERSRLAYLSNFFNELLGYNIRNISNNGFQFFESIIHPSDRKGVFFGYQKIWQHLNQLPMELIEQFKASLDFRVRRSNGRYVRLLQEISKFSTDNMGNCVYAEGRCVDITHWGKSQDIALTIIDQDNLHQLTIPTRVRENIFFSKREKQILLLLASGLSSKAVARSLDISYHTVNTHRQNMLNKLGMHKTTGLVNFALNQGII